MNKFLCILMVISREAVGILTSYLALFKKELRLLNIKNAELNPRPNLEPDIEFRIPSND